MTDRERAIQVIADTVLYGHEYTSQTVGQRGAALILDALDAAGLEVGGAERMRERCAAVAAQCTVCRPNFGTRDHIAAAILALPLAELEAAK